MKDMTESESFGKNLLAIQKKNNWTATAMAMIINDKNGSKVVDNSYISKICKAAKQGSKQNVSLDMATKISIGLGISLNDMIREDCLNSPPEGALSFHSESLLLAFKHVDSFSEKLDISNPEFKAKAFEIQYKAIVTGDVGESTAELMLLAKEFGI